MFRIRSRHLAGILFAAALVLMPGCSTAIVSDAARGSLASFLTTVFSQAVNTTIVG
ncbi:MAG: hypothetical protein ACE5E5_02825 [Phycisphaerae bacterium]